MSSTPEDTQRSSVVSPAKAPRRTLGVGRVLIVVYAILAIGATSRAVFQIAMYFPHVPSARLPIALSAVSGVIYIMATIALIAPGRAWYRIAWVTISFELAGVLVIGTLSLALPSIFLGPTSVPDVADGTVWSSYGIGYLFIPLVLPVLGMLWLRSRRAVVAGV